MACFSHICLIWNLISFLSSINKAIIINGQDVKPNILFILADDWGYGDMSDYSVYPNNGSHAKLLTPRLDEFATQSMRFTDAYCGAPVCAPSRCTLMTGQHSGHCAVRANGQFLTKSDLTVANVLSEYGKYDTSMFGKWGIGNYNTSFKNDPPNKGFNYWIGQLNQNNCHNYYPYLQYENSEMIYIEANKDASVENCVEPNYVKCNWTGDFWTEKLIQYLSTKTNDPTPFFSFLSFTTPHAGSVGNDNENDIPVPNVTNGPYYKTYNGTWPKVEIDFATAVTMIDALIGNVLDALDTYGLSNNTVVFFASDNGAHDEGGHDYEYFASSGPLSGYKRSLKEGGHRSDLVVRWPGYIEAGTISDWQWAFYDLMATSADLAGVSNTSLPTNDGVSMVKTLLGEKQSYDERKFVYHEYCNPNEDKAGWGMAVRVENYTGLCIGPQPKDISDIPNGVCNGTFELYDLTNDIAQTKNIADANSDMVTSMLSIMKEQHKTGNYCTGA